MSLSAIPKLLRLAVLARDGDRCGYCRLRQFGQASTFHMDHIIPRASGGRTSLDNLVLQCPSCSLRKASKTKAVDPVSGRATELFHPLRDSWPEHFVILDDGSCQGLTPIGRATIEALDMNHPYPRTARAIQRQIGILLRR